MKSSAKVSVIIPVYKAEAFVLSAVQSILNQSYENLEILICVDDSPDNSYAILMGLHDARITVMKNEKNLGYLRTINKLLSLATGEYIAFQDADDISHPERIALQVKCLTENPDIALVGTNFCIINERGVIVHQYLRQLTDFAEINRQLMEHNVFQKPSILFHRKVYATIHGFREGFLRLKNISEDYDWLLRASEQFTMSNVNGNEALYQYRSVPSAMSKGLAHVEQGFGHKIAQYLARERRAGHLDSLAREDWATLENLIQSLKIPYQKDRSLFYYEKTESLLYAGLNFIALKNAGIAVMHSPLRWRNIRCFAYCIKVILYSLIKINTR